MLLLRANMLNRGYVCATKSIQDIGSPCTTGSIQDRTTPTLIRDMAMAGHDQIPIREVNCL
jgi:hypothetical protein